MNNEIAVDTKTTPMKSKDLSCINSSDFNFDKESIPPKSKAVPDGQELS